jgi:quercetin dioxygenase-like cupin family protein
VFTFRVAHETVFNAEKHVEKVLGAEGGGDFSVACWEPGQVSPYHCHPGATEIYLCLQGGGVMYTPGETAQIVPGAFVVHPRGELHEYENGPQRTVLFRVRHGIDMTARRIGWRGHPELGPTPADIAYFDEHPPGVVFNPDGPSH